MSNETCGRVRLDDGGGDREKLREGKGAGREMPNPFGGVQETGETGPKIWRNVWHGEGGTGFFKAARAR